MSQNRVLIIKLGSMGDILQSTPVIDAIVDHANAKFIDVLTFDEHRQLFHNHPKVRKVMGLKRSALSILKMTGIILFSRYTIGFNLHRSVYLDLFLFFCRVKKRFGFSSPEKRTWFLTGSAPFNLKLPRHYRYLSLVQQAVKASFDGSSYGISYYGDPLEVEREGRDIPYIVIAPFGGHNRYADMPSRVWPGYRELIHLILKAHPKYQIVLTGGPLDVTRLNALKLPFDERVTVFQGDVNQLAVLLESALCFIGNDSFPLFMAIATKCKAFAIFGPTDSERIVGPYNDVFFLQSDVSCSPCYNPLDGLKSMAYHCPYEFKCMTSISPKKVFQKVSEVCF